LALPAVAQADNQRLLKFIPQSDLAVQEAKYNQVIEMQRSGHAAEYREFRPAYPPELFTYLASLTSGRQLAWDCGTGNGGTFEAWRGNGALPPVGAVAPSIEAASASNFTEPIPPVQISSGQMDDLSSRQDQTAVSSRRELRADKGRRRTRAIEKALSQGGGAGVYSPKPQRDRLFKALRSCLPREGPPKTLLQLTREIRREASSAEGAADFPFWHPATQSFVGMLLGAGILRDELGNCVHDSLFAKSSQILSFREPLEDLCEAFLLETAISELADITESDKVPLAHALFWDKGSSDRDQVEERLEHVLKLLEGRLNVTAEGVWYIEDPEGVNERTATGAA
jgi:hypothetical protein